MAMCYSASSLRRPSSLSMNTTTTVASSSSMNHHCHTHHRYTSSSSSSSLRSRFTASKRCITPTYRRRVYSNNNSNSNSNNTAKRLLIARATGNDSDTGTNDTKTDSASVGASCDVNALKDGNFAGCSLKDLEMMYVDSVWNYYKGDKEKMIDNETYDMLKLELNFQASGMPDLSRREVEFVEASICYARGEPIMTDEEYEELKKEVKIIGKKMDITAMMLSVKGQEYLTAEQYKVLSEKMLAMGIDVNIEGATCTLTQPPDTVENQIDQVLKMYLAIGFLPTLLSGVLPVSLALLVSHGSFPNPVAGFSWTVLSGSVITYFMIRYMDLHNTEILVGQCPCCEGEVKLLFSGESPKESDSLKCPNCGTMCTFNRVKKVIVTA